MNINRLTRLLIVPSALVFFGHTSLVLAEPPPFDLKEVKVITPDDGYFNGWPTIVRRSNGELIVVWSGGRMAHVDPFGRVESMISRDEGETWSWPRVLLDTGLDDRDAGILETAKGTLVLATFSAVSYGAPGRRDRLSVADVEKWERFDRGGSAAELATHQARWIVRSEDGGQTWMTPIKVTFGSPHGPMQLADGRLLYPAAAGAPDHLRTPLGSQDKRVVGAWESSDDGRSWQFLTSFPVMRGDKEDYYFEPHGVQALDGTIIVHIRSQPPAGIGPARRKGQTLQSESKDGGRTWTEPRELGIFGYPSHLLRLRNGHLVMAYTNREGPHQILARVSEDHGSTWSEAMILTSTNQRSDMGYPATAELSNGSLITVWYETLPGSPRAVLRQAKWSLSKGP